MKKFLMVVLSCVMLALMSGVALADDTEVTVSIANGDAVLVQKPVTVTDTDGDGALTIADALYCAHEAYFTGGAAAGFACSMGTYGLQLDKLWGVDNGTGYGYYVNNAAAMGLGDPVKSGDFIYAFVYTDTVGWSDTYCFFDKNEITVKEGETITLTLMAAGYDENWAPITKPLAGAVITANGVKTPFVTDENGTVSAAIPLTGSAVVSAVVDGVALVPPTCIVTIEAKEEVTPTEEPTKEPTPTPTTAPTVTPVPETKDGKTQFPLWAIIAIIACGVVVCGAVVFILTKKKD
ncbi:MAG: hypothetical protein IKW95_02445 [Lachnospiraceae bacterium]|nr:hypothetical protein [Lachnospiraceae bacterium]